MLKTALFFFQLLALLILSLSGSPAFSVEESHYGPVANNENLWDIAAQVKPDDSLITAQVALAIFQHNPEAFRRNNLNGLMHGYTLIIPAASEMHSISKQTAESMFTQHWEDWKSGKTQTASAQDTDLPESPLSTASSVTSFKVEAAEQTVHPEAEEQAAVISSVETNFPSASVATPPDAHTPSVISTPESENDITQEQGDPIPVATPAVDTTSEQYTMPAENIGSVENTAPAENTVLTENTLTAESTSTPENKPRDNSTDSLSVSLEAELQSATQTPLSAENIKVPEQLSDNASTASLLSEEPAFPVTENVLSLENATKDEEAEAEVKQSGIRAVNTYFANNTQSMNYMLLAAGFFLLLPILWLLLRKEQTYPMVKVLANKTAQDLDGITQGHGVKGQDSPVELDEGLEKAANKIVIEVDPATDEINYTSPDDSVQKNDLTVQDKWPGQDEAAEKTANKISFEVDSTTQEINIAAPKDATQEDDHLNHLEKLQIKLEQSQAEKSSQHTVDDGGNGRKEQPETELDKQMDQHQMDNFIGELSDINEKLNETYTAIKMDKANISSFNHFLVHMNMIKQISLFFDASSIYEYSSGLVELLQCQLNTENGINQQMLDIMSEVLVCNDEIIKALQEQRQLGHQVGELIERAATLRREYCPENTDAHISNMVSSF